MKSQFTYFIYCCVFLICTPSYSQYYNTVVEAKIITNNTSDDELIELQATATNLSEVNQNLRYVFSVIKNDNSNNNSKNSQEGHFLLIPSEKKNLSTTAINFNATDQIIVLLLIYDIEDVLLGKDRLVFKEKELKTTEKIVLDEKGFEDTYFKGIVTEDTKTKAGRDFYKLFESSYRLRQINGTQIVTIKEVFSLGRNTNIEVRVGQQLVYTFPARPKQDYLKAVTNQSLYLVVRHFQNLKNLENQIQQY